MRTRRFQHSFCMIYPKSLARVNIVLVIYSAEENHRSKYCEK